MKLKSLFLAGCVLFSGSAFAQFAAFKVSHIQFEGLSRITTSMLQNDMTIKAGQKITAAGSDKLIKSLFKTGYFKNVSLQKSDDNLIVKVVERPTIAKITFKGNDLVKTKVLKPVLLKVGLQVGNMFDRSTLSRLKQSLEQQYYQLGKYAVKIKTDIKPLSRNRVDIVVHVSEGLYATVERVNFVGNHHFSESALQDQFALTTPSLWTFFNDDDRYTQKKMDVALQGLSDFYMNHGFLKFHVVSSQVALSSTHKKVFLTVNVAEGGEYHFGKINLQGNLVLTKSVLEPLVEVKSGALFSRKAIMDSVKAIQNALANKGYAFATVNPVPTVNDKTHVVSIALNINPGHKVTVHELIFTGNNVTNDKTLRQRATFSAGSLFNKAKIDNTLIRYQRLPYIAHATVKKLPVKGSTDEVNVNYDMKERSANQVGATLGYSELNKLIIGANLAMPNVFGTGNAFNINMQLSKPYQSLNFSYTDPYFTQYGISQTVSIYLTKLDNQHRSLVSYSQNQMGASLSYGIPLGTFSTFNIGGGVDHSQLVNPYDSTSLTVRNYTRLHGNNFNSLTTNFGWDYDTTNSAFFPTNGLTTSFGGTMATPISNLTWFKLYSNAAWYHPLLWKGVSVSLDGGMSYGDGYGKLKNLPFFENFYGGGWGSVRGFSQGSLGPRDKIECGTDASQSGCTDEGSALGGNLKLHASMSVFFPIPFTTSPDLRMGMFADAGNVYDTYHLQDTYNSTANPTRPNFENLRYSVGAELQWLSPLGALGFSLAKPLNAKPGDDIQYFQFTLGRTF